MLVYKHFEQQVGSDLLQVDERLKRHNFEELVVFRRQALVCGQH